MSKVHAYRSNPIHAYVNQVLETAYMVRRDLEDSEMLPEEIEAVGSEVVRALKLETERARMLKRVVPQAVHGTEQVFPVSVSLAEVVDPRDVLRAAVGILDARYSDIVRQVDALPEIDRRGMVERLQAMLPDTVRLGVLRADETRDTVQATQADLDGGRIDAVLIETGPLDLAALLHPVRCPAFPATHILRVADDGTLAVRRANDGSLTIDNPMGPAILFANDPSRDRYVLDGVVMSQAQWAASPGVDPAAVEREALRTGTQLASKAEWRDPMPQMFGRVNRWAHGLNSDPDGIPETPRKGLASGLHLQMYGRVQRHGTPVGPALVDAPDAPPHLGR